jgi:conjugative transposon TraJ protein
MFFPTFVLGTINAVMSPVVKGCNQMLQSQTFDIKKYSQMKARAEHDAMMKNPETARLVDNDTFDKQLSELGITDAPKIAGMYIERSMYDLKKQIRDWFREILEIMFQAASLVIDTIRTFYLIVLAILGPVAFAISIYDGFGSTLTQWISRYISVYLWLPVSDLFSSIIAQIQIKILQNDITNIQNGTSAIFDSANTVYIIFLLIGIVGYFTIPTVANWIISAGGMGAYGKNITSAAGWAGARAGAASGAISGNIAGRLVNKEEK